MRLGVAQTLAWASSFYLPAMLAAPMARDLGTSVSQMYLLLSGALLVSAAVGPLSGRLVDRHGGRPVLMFSNGLFVAGLALLALAPNTATAAAAWLLLGLGMGCGLYDTAFAALVRIHGAQARGAISGITLIAGFASTVGWPLSAWLEHRYGWRGSCGAWALLHVVVALPLNASLPLVRAAAEPPAVAAKGDGAAGVQPTASQPRPRVMLLAGIFMLMSFVSTSIATHLPALLQAAGATLAAAVALGALVGPSQVASRVVELSLLRHVNPLFTARAAVLGHPLGALALLIGGPVAALPFVVLHGLGNGLFTIVRGNLAAGAVRQRGLWRKAGLAGAAGTCAGGLVTVAFRAGAGTVRCPGLVVHGGGGGVGAGGAGGVSCRRRAGPCVTLTCGTPRFSRPRTHAPAALCLALRAGSRCAAGKAQARPSPAAAAPERRGARANAETPP